MLSLSSHRSDEALRFGGVRRSVWALLIAALLIAVLVPTVTIWRAAHAEIVASACVWPAAPTVGHPAELRVTLSDATDRAAVHGPWGQIVAAWDMPTMQMREQRQATTGDSAASGSYVIPLSLEMAGSWRVQVALHTPGRPDWQTTLAVLVHETSAPLASLTGTHGSSGSTATASCTSF